MFLISAYYLRTFHSDVSRWTTLFKASGMCLIISILWSIFFWVNWNHIFTLVIFLFSKVFRFHTYSILIIITMMTLSLKFLELRNKISLFPMQEDGMQAIFVLLCKKSFLCLSLKCFLKGPVKIWHIKTTVGYLCTLQVPQIFPIFTKLL